MAVVVDMLMVFCKGIISGDSTARVEASSLFDDCWEGVSSESENLVSKACNNSACSAWLFVPDILREESLLRLKYEGCPISTADGVRAGVFAGEDTD